MFSYFFTQRSLLATFCESRFISWARLAERQRLVGLLKQVKLTCRFGRESSEALWSAVRAVGRPLHGIASSVETSGHTSVILVLLYVPFIASVPCVG